METRTTQLHTGGRAWGPERVALGISIRKLAELSGVDKAILSLVENGRMIPTGPEYDAVMNVLREVRETQPDRAPVS